VKASKVVANIAIEGRAAPCEVVELSGAETISDLYAFEVTFDVDVPLDLAAVAGRAAAVSLEAPGETRWIHGRLAHVEELEAPAKSQRYRATLRPDVWHLGERVDCRIFQDATVPEVLARVCAAAGIARVRFALRRSYDKRDLCVQYRESDWAFASRLMEDEGIFHFFEHAEDGHTWVVADDVSASRDAGAGTLPFIPPAGGLDGGATGIESIRLERTVRPGRFALRAIAFDSSAAPSDAEATGERADLAHYEPGPERRPTDRLEALQATRDVARGTARTAKLVCGGTFVLDDHPREALDRGWLATRLAHRLARDEGGRATYTCDYVAIPDDVPFRPERRTPRPRIPGPQAADVVGPTGTEIHTDEQGRVSVRMRWDRETVSLPCWVHVAQSMAGAGFGAMSIPRVGSAVLVGFLDGDPDLPIITGRVYDRTRPYPYPLPAEKTKTGIVTRSTPGGDGHNELRFEDAAGKEAVFIRAQRDLSFDVRHDRAATIAHDDAVRVGGDRTAAITGRDTTTVGQARSVTVGGVETKTVGAAQTVKVGGAQSIIVGGTRTVTVAGELRETIVRTAERQVTGNDVWTVGGNRELKVGGKQTTTIEGTDSTTIGGTQTLSVNGNLQHIVDGQATQVFGSLQLAVEGTSLVQTGSDSRIESSTSVKVGAPAIVLSGNTLTLRAYEKIVLEVGSSSVDADDRPRLEITTSGVFVTNGDAKERLSGSVVRLNC
jgi:type VI secretion system secreted protein VgrG